MTTLEERFWPWGSRLYDISLRTDELNPCQRLHDALHVEAPFANLCKLCANFCDHKEEDQEIRAQNESFQSGRKLILSPDLQGVARQPVRVYGPPPKNSPPAFVLLDEEGVVWVTFVGGGRA
jgi:hypothetical protein